ncbi:MAG: hypothetical protein MMC23_006384 [Stictis urceolatum]|nr:hypothetical protein [Stictis urceolata]
MGLLGRTLGTAVGLTAEAFASRKDGPSTPSKLPQSQEPEDLDQKHASGPSATSSQADLDPPPAYSLTASSDDFDEEQWQLDDAAASSNPSSPAPEVPKGNAAGPATITHLVTAFTTSHPIPPGSLGQTLSLPIILPQRRPRDKSRGFVRAYAPLLSAIGIPEPTWLSFLASFDEAIRLGPVFNVINIAANTAGLVGTFIPSPTLNAVVTAVQVSEQVARRTYERARTNSFLDEMNRAWLQPQGLFALVLTYRPSSAAASVPMDLSSTIAKLAPGEEQGVFKSQFKKIRGSDGRVQGEAQLPPAAPLIYPALDRASQEQKGWWASKSAFVTDYMDRRAQAVYASENPGSKLGMQPEFASKWGHPDAVKQFDRRKGGGLVGGVRNNMRGAGEGGSGYQSGEYVGQATSSYEQRFYTRGRTLGADAGERRDMRRGRSPGGGLLGGPGLISGRVRGRSGGDNGRGRSGLLGGGAIGLVAGAAQMARGKESKDLDPAKYSLRGANGKSGVIGRAKQALRADVLYLMVVPMPSKEEMRIGREGLEVREEQAGRD